MGLTKNSGGRHASNFAKSGRIPDHSALIAMVGNPNVGKSSLFNAMTGLHQHTGNWTGKTVGCAVGVLKQKWQKGSHEKKREGEKDQKRILLADLPGCYSLVPRTAEEEAALDFLLTHPLSGAIVVCDAQALERNLILAFQLMQILPREHILLCVNLIDEAIKQGIEVDAEALQQCTGCRVVMTSAREGIGMDQLVTYMKDIVEVEVADKAHDEMAEQTMEAETEMPPSRAAISPSAVFIEKARSCAAASIFTHLKTMEQKTDAQTTVAATSASSSWRAQLDRLVMGKWTAIPIALCFLALTLWITVYGANMPSEWLAALFDRLGEALWRIPLWSVLPSWVSGLLIDGIYTTVARVTSVMLPPMAIFFPLFTLLEDAGFLPRIAFNFDRCFKSCNACGKQALTMCMGLGCCAAGVTGCRIIDSPRERLVAILTNSFMPCNGKFPTLLAMAAICLTMAGNVSGGSASLNSLLVAALLTVMVLICILMTFLISKLLTTTILRGTPSSFILEIPPYRFPNIPQVLIRSLLDRTLFVLGRAVSVAAPAGAVLWFMTHIPVSELHGDLLSLTTDWLHPLGVLLCVDGAVLLSLLLSAPANELTVPILLMIYTAGTGMAGYVSSSDMACILQNAGWSIWESIGFLTLFLFHAPCATTLITIKKETGKMRWTLLAAVLPALVGILLCLGISLVRVLIQ